jgi:hypothetical protein
MYVGDIASALKALNEAAERYERARGYYGAGREGEDLKAAFRDFCRLIEQCNQESPPVSVA